MASISDSVLAGQGYGHLRFEDGVAEIHDSWIREFVGLDSLIDFIEPDMISNRFVHARDIFHRGAGEVYPVRYCENMRYAFPKWHAEMDDLTQEFETLVKFHNTMLPVPLPVGLVSMVTKDRGIHLLTEYQGADTLQSLITRKVFFEEVASTEEYVVANLQWRNAHAYSSAILSTVNRRFPEEKKLEFHKGRYQKKLYKEHRKSERDVLNKRDALNKTVKKLCKKLRVSEDVLYEAVHMSAVTLRAFSDEGVQFWNPAPKQFLLTRDFDVKMVDFSSIKQHDAALDIKHRRNQMHAFFNAAGIPAEAQKIFKEAYL